MKFFNFNKLLQGGKRSVTDMPALFDFKPLNLTVSSVQRLPKNWGVIKYAGGDAFGLNARLRSGQLTSADFALIRSIDNSLQQIPNYTKATFRQVGFGTQEQLNDFMAI